MCVEKQRRGEKKDVGHTVNMLDREKGEVKGCDGRGLLLCSTALCW